MWNGLKTMIGIDKKKEQISTVDDKSFAEELNTFYARFDQRDFSEELKNELNSSTFLDTTNDLRINVDNVKSCFRKINIRKATGPDNLRGIVLKSCADQLSPVFCKLYQISLDSQRLPKVWKNQQSYQFQNGVDLKI